MWAQHLLFIVDNFMFKFSHGFYNLLQLFAERNKVAWVFQMELHSMQLSNSFSRVLSSVSHQDNGGNQGTMNNQSMIIIHIFLLNKVRFCNSPFFTE